MASCIKTPSSRGGNLVDAMPSRIGSPTDVRWATGRNVKRSLPDRRWDVVEVWALKTRDASGKVITVREHCSRKVAEDWVRDGTQP